MIHLLDEVEMFQLGAKHNEVEGRFCLQLPGIRVDGVKEFEGVGRAGDVSQLPVDLDKHACLRFLVFVQLDQNYCKYWNLTLDARDVEEHVALGQVGGCGEGGQAQLVLDVDGCPALDSHVKHLRNFGDETLQSQMLSHPHVVVDG